MSKWLNKRSQAVSEALNKNVKKTEWDPEFQDLELQTDATKTAVEKLMKQVPVFLHPNPAARAAMSIGTSVAKLRKTAAEKRYPHPVGELGDQLLKLDGLAPDSPFGQALRETGDALTQINEASHQMDAEVQQNFLEPLKSLMDHDLKEVYKFRKKLEGRRLDYDFKVRKRESGKTSITDADVKIAEQKMDESKVNTENGMVNLLDNGVEQACQIQAFANAYLQFFETGTTMMRDLVEKLDEIVAEAGERPRERRVVQSYDEEEEEPIFDDGASSGDGPCCKAVFEFDAENEGELSFPEGAIINLTSRLDENWLEGEFKGSAGIFPSSYVEIIRDL